MREGTFREACQVALREGGYAYDLRVGGRGWPETIALGGRWAGAEFKARWRSGTGEVRARDEVASVVVEDVVVGMRRHFETQAVEPDVASCIKESGFGIAVAAVLVVLR